MKYIVQLCLINDVLNEETFHTENQAFIHIGRIIRNSLFPIKVEVEGRFSVKDGVEVLTETVYHLYEQE